MDYEAFLEQKTHYGEDCGLAPIYLPDCLFDFQASLVTWALRRGRAAIFADCGLGKTLMQLVWAENIVRQTGKRVLILTPLAVSFQTVREAEKFGLHVTRSQDGTAPAGITVTNYERLSAFDPQDFVGCVADESSILKSFDGVRRQQITEFLRTLPYRLLCTATAAPNDYVELGTSSEALGELGHLDMLTRFFRNQRHTSDTKRHWRGHAAPRRWEGQPWRFKGHAEGPFWQWVCSWARAVRQPSDLGFANDGFVLPPLRERPHLVASRTLADGMLFAMPAVGWREQREERRRTLHERCEHVASVVNQTGQPALVWCQLNAEGTLLEQLIPDAVQISGADADDHKESAFHAFVQGNIRVLVTKSKIAGWGINMQHCAHIIYFPSHSYESYYQSIRRCWRFGQTQPVTVDLVMTEGDQQVMETLQRKARAADAMFSRLRDQMNQALSIARSSYRRGEVRLPAWLS